MAKHDELTLDEALSDPMIAALMQADRTDAATLRRAWAPLVASLRQRIATPREAGATGTDRRDWQALIEDCICAARRQTLAGEARSRTGWN